MTARKLKKLDRATKLFLRFTFRSKTRKDLRRGMKWANVMNRSVAATLRKGTHDEDTRASLSLGCYLPRRRKSDRLLIREHSAVHPP